MLIKKIFKKFRKFEDNLLCSSKLSYYAYTKYNKKKWGNFKKPLNNIYKNEDYIKISSFYKKDLFIKQKQKIFDLGIKKNLNIATALVETRFCKSYQEAFFFIKIGSVIVNNKVATNQRLILYPGDTIILKNKKQKLNWITSCFFTKFKKVTTNYSFPLKYEISFAGNFFIICF